MSDINVNFTINQFNADLSIDPAPNVTMSIADPMVANFFIEGTTGGANPAGNVTELQYKTSNTTFGASNALSFFSVANSGPYDNASTLYLGKNTGNVLNGIQIYAGGNSGSHRIDSIYTGAFKTFSIRAGTDPNIGHVFLIQGADATSTNAGTSGGNLNLFAGGALNAGANGIGGSVNIRAGNATANVTNYSSGNVSLLTFGGNVSLLSSGALQINGSTGNSGQVLTSAGSGAAPTWSTPTSTGTVTSVNTSGSGLGFSLGGGPITTTGTISLTVPSDTALRSSLNIGNVANINLNGNGSQVLAGNGTWVAQSGGSGGFSGNILSSSIQVTQAAEVYGGTNILIPFPAVAPMAYKIRWWCYGSSGTSSGPGSGFARMRLRIGPNGNISDTGSVSVERQIFSQTWSGEWTILVLRNNQFRICFEGWNGDPVNFPQMTTTSNMGWISNSNNATATTITQPTYIGFSGSVFNAIPDGFGNYPFFWFADAIAYRIL